MTRSLRVLRPVLPHIPSISWASLGKQATVVQVTVTLGTFAFLPLLESYTWRHSRDMCLRGWRCMCSSTPVVCHSSRLDVGLAIQCFTTKEALRGVDELNTLQDSPDVPGSLRIRSDYITLGWVERETRHSPSLTGKRLVRWDSFVPAKVPAYRLQSLSSLLQTNYQPQGDWVKRKVARGSPCWISSAEASSYQGAALDLQCSNTWWEEE